MAHIKCLKNTIQYYSLLHPIPISGCVIIKGLQMNIPLIPCILFTAPFLKSVFYFLDSSAKDTSCKWLKTIKLMAFRIIFFFQSFKIFWIFIFNIILLYPGLWLMLVSGVQQRDSVIHIHVSILFQIIFLYRLSQSSLCYIVGPCGLFDAQYCVSVNPKLLIYPSPQYS